MKDLLTKKQVTQMLNVSPVTLIRWVKKGRIKAIVVNDRGDRRYRPEDIEEFLNKKYE